MPTPKFTHLHVHSHYSLLDGLPKIPDLVARAKELGMDSLALTDHGVLYGAIEFYKACKAQDIKPIIGIETYLAPNGMEGRRPNIDDTRYHLILLAKNEEGYRNLLALSTKAYLEGYYYKPRIDKKLLKLHGKGLIGLSACLGGEIPRMLLGNRTADAERALEEYGEIFGKGNFYLEIQNHPKIPEQVKLNGLLIDLSRKTGAPLVATGDIHYLYKEDSEAQDVLMAINTNHKTLDSERLSMREEDFSMHSPEEMASFFPEIPEAVSNTQRIAGECSLEIELGKTQLPHYDVPDGKSDDGYLRELCEAGLGRRYSEITPEIRQRLDYELDAISKTGFSSYFLVVQDFVNWAKNNGIVVGPGRGSAAGSLVAYVLNITNVDPLRYGLLFERFINPERISPPDIDLDFTDLRRDEVLEYVSKKYGREHVAQIVTFGTMKARLVVRDVARVLGFPYQLGDSLAKSIPFGFDLARALAESDELKAIYETNADAKRVVDTARKLEGVARHASTHACGVVITRDPLIQSVPLQLATKQGNGKPGENENEKAVVSQYEMHAIEDLGLLKMDFLGLKNLSIIESALNLIEKDSGTKLNIDTIALDDPKTFGLLQRAETTGVFQLECLSGDTIVSNTTVKRLFEKRDKQRLEAVYLDEGKVRKNQVVDVVKNGKKETYTVIAGNGWYIRATKEHFFMTQDGWKKLGNIAIGERILMKTKAKHEIYNICKKCEKQINGQREGNSDFCYRCSAKFYSNPSKPISREKMRLARNRFYSQGGKPWNIGVTTENNAVWKATAEKISRALTGVTMNQRYGKEKADMIRKALSEKSRGRNNAMFGKPTPHRKRGFRPDLGHFVRSSWEADFARILKLHNVQYQYEPKTFPLIQDDGEMLHYTPDFYTPHDNTFYEIKGWLHDLDQRKMDLFQRQYPQYCFVLINTTRFAEFAIKYKKLIAWECPRIPVERNFEFISVKEIRYYGTEETYDILMQSPGNNFVASGFVVHNSGGMRRYLLELKPTELEDIIAMVALYRPGPMELIPAYISRKHGREKVVYLHPKLEPILKNTYGIGVYQEQMMQIARDLAGYTLPQADTLRKAIGKKIKSLLEEQREKLISGMKTNGVDAKTAEAIWELFPPFARYGFNRCLTGDTQVMDPVSGTLATLKALHEKEKRLLSVLSLEQNLKIKNRTVSDVISNGKKRVWKVTTRSGRTIKATANHPFLTPRNWQKLEDITVGEKIAVARALPEAQKPLRIETYKLGLLGYLLAEGNLCHPHGFYFYSKSSEEVNDYLRFLHAFKNTKGKVDHSKPASSVYAGRIDLKKPSEAVSWIESLGLKYKKATKKFFPPFVFRLSNADLAFLIAKMFQGDGCVNNKRDPQIFYATSSTDIARGLQHLLLRLEILSSVHEKRFKYRGGINIGYTVTISRYDNISKLLEACAMHFVGEKRTVAQKILAEHPIINGTLPIWSARGSYDTVPVALVRDHMREAAMMRHESLRGFARDIGVSWRLFLKDKRKIGYLRETVEIIGRSLGDKQLLTLAGSDVYWDEVKSIEPAGIADTYDLTVDETHNFVANDIIVHNSHAACYATVAYQTAYLKAHYPAEFMAALLTADLGDIERTAFLVSECRKMKINVLPPDVNESDEYFTVVDARTLRFGLAAVKNVGENVVQSIIQERNQKDRFASIADFIERIHHKDLNKKSLESLIKAGALDAMAERGQILANLDYLLEYARALGRSQSQGQTSLFASLPNNESSLKLSPALPASKHEKLVWEKELLGLYVSSHPLEDFRERLSRKAVPIARLAVSAMAGRATIGGVVTSMKKILTKTGKPMLFVGLEDLSGKIETVVFPDSLERNPGAWQQDKILLVSGRLSNRDGTLKLLCESAEELQ
jgi:DNA polymerase III alpha subunit/intein/homing endonuclease